MFSGIFWNYSSRQLSVHRLEKHVGKAAAEEAENEIETAENQKIRVRNSPTLFCSETMI